MSQRDDFESAPFPEDEPKHVVPPVGFTEVPFIEPGSTAAGGEESGYTKIPAYDGVQKSSMHIPFPQESRVVPPSAFPELAFNDENEPMAIEDCLCMNCFKKGTTRLLPTMIPYFKEVHFFFFFFVSKRL